MHQKQKIRLLKLCTLLLLVASGICLTLSSLQNNIVFFYPPSDLHIFTENGKKIRVGGLVKFESIIFSFPRTDFIIMDDRSELRVSYTGILPALFREGQGVVAEGSFSKKDKIFYASSLLTKHDENYYPKNIRNSSSLSK